MYQICQTLTVSMCIKLDKLKHKINKSTLSAQPVLFSYEFYNILTIYWI